MGCAAPIVVPGAIAARLAAIVTNIPADAALAPDGATYTITGSGAPSRSSTSLRVVLNKPPGVSNSMTNARALRACAALIDCSTKSATAGLIDASTSITTTGRFTTTGRSVDGTASTYAPSNNTIATTAGQRRQFAQTPF